MYCTLLEGVWLSENDTNEDCMTSIKASFPSASALMSLFLDNPLSVFLFRLNDISLNQFLNLFGNTTSSLT